MTHIHKYKDFNCVPLWLTLPIDIYFNGIWYFRRFFLFFYAFTYCVYIFYFFSSDHDVKKLITHVNAIILGVPLPFVGVDGTSACNNLYLEDGKTKANCPLRAGEKYVYRNTFDVLPIYPIIGALDVHWALLESSNKELVCFEIPSKITN